ncbi:MAG TPA: hypothetical protein VGL58_02640 [Caulobacteraceae bacterium]
MDRHRVGDLTVGRRREMHAAASAFLVMKKADDVGAVGQQLGIEPGQPRQRRLQRRATLEQASKQGQQRRQRAPEQGGGEALVQGVAGDQRAIEVDHQRWIRRRGRRPGPARAGRVTTEDLRCRQRQSPDSVAAAHAAPRSKLPGADITLTRRPKCARGRPRSDDAVR